MRDAAEAGRLGGKGDLAAAGAPEAAARGEPRPPPAARRAPGAARFLGEHVRPSRRHRTAAAHAATRRLSSSLR